MYVSIWLRLATLLKLLPAVAGLHALIHWQLYIMIYSASLHNWIWLQVCSALCYLVSVCTVRFLQYEQWGNCTSWNVLVSHARLLCNRKQRNSLHGHMNHVSVALRPESCPHQSDLSLLTHIKYWWSQAHMQTASGEAQVGSVTHAHGYVCKVRWAVRVTIIVTIWVSSKGGALCE